MKGGETILKSPLRSVGLSLVVFVFVLFDETKTESDDGRGFFPERCFGELGCFDNGGWFALRQPNKLPQSPDEIGAQFLLNTEKKPNPSHPDVIEFNDVDQVRGTSYDPRKKTKILVHGFLASGIKGAWPEMASAILDVMDVNVIRVDWSQGNGFPFEQATANTRVVGAQIALLIRRLCDRFQQTLADFHIIGHSLGAHTAGYAGERLRGLDRITGLDPAEPYFQFLHSSIRLDQTDANFVDVIHTDGQSIFNIVFGGSGFGLMQRSGHVDFYPNGGLRQPGCSKKDLCKDIFSGDIQTITDKVACSHQRAVLLFIESLRSRSANGCGFSAKACRSFRDYERGRCGGDCGAGVKCAEMGMFADETLRGEKDLKLYLVTNEKSPYCKRG